MRILLVVNHLDTARYISQQLEAVPQTSVGLADGHAQALRMACAGTDEIILISLNQSGEKSGVALVEELRRIGIVVPIIVFGDEAQVGTKTHVLDRGADAYVHMHYHYGLELVSQINALVRRQRAYENAASTEVPKVSLRVVG